MSMNIDLSSILTKIANDSSFVDGSEGKFSKGETLFISGTSAKGDMVTLKDSSGDSYNVSAQELKGYLTDEELQALMSNSATVQVGSTEATSATSEVSEVGEVEATTEVGETAEVGTTSAAIQDEIDKLEAQRLANLDSMETLKDQIEDLKDEIQDSINAAIQEMEDIEEEQKKKAQEVVDEELQKFKNSNGEMTQDEFNANVQSQLAAINPSMGSVISELLNANTKTALMSNLLGQLDSKVAIDSQLCSQIDTKNTELDAAIAAEEAQKAAEEAQQQAAQTQSNSCDPIGFQMQADSDGDGTVGTVQFDFFYDQDGDGQINSLDDFVGAKADKADQDGWSEIENLDGVGGEADGVITADELSNAGMKVMVTDENGEQYAMSMDEFEAQYGEIAINSQDVEAGEEGFASGVGPNNFGTDADNKLLSSFNLSVGDQDLTGYQTSDTEDWLVENYSDVMDLDSIAAEGVDVSGVGSGSEAVGAVEGAGSAEAQQYVEFSKQYREEVLPKLEAQIDEAYAELGLSQDAITAFKNIAKAEADVEGQKVADDLKAQEEEKAQQLYEEAQAAKEAEEAAAAEEEAAAEEAAEEDADVSEEDTPNFDDLEVGETVDTTESTSELEDLLDEEEA